MSASPTTLKALVNAFNAHELDGIMGSFQSILTGTPASGKRIEVRGCDFYTFRDGKVVKKDSFWKIVEK